MEIYIVRHGETVWNQSRLLQGSRDIELSKEGREAAIIRGEQLKEIDFDIIYSSPLSRAYETASIIRGDRKIEIVKDERLREINFGVNEGQSSLELQKDKKHPFYKFFHDPGNYQAPEGGESLKDVAVRTKEFMEQVIEPQKDKLNRILIAGHGAMNKGIMCHVLNHGLDEYWSGGLQKNCGVFIVKLDNSGYEQIGELQ